MSTLLAFTIDQTSRLTGLSVGRLRRWDNIGFFTPHYADPNRRLPSSRVYSFRDLVGLRTLALLRQEKVPFKQLRTARQWFADRYEAPWSELTFYVVGGNLFFDDGDHRMGATAVGQSAFSVSLRTIAEDMERRVEELRRRNPRDIGQISRQRNVMSNAPVVTGTRVPTSAIWSFHEDGYSVDAIIEQYPILTREDVEAAIAFEEERRTKHAV
ncbi:MAG: DUF433 domain-containing protein [Chloroflexota bacterium]|nr:MAG: DUF433 domain-containing protein [Chloroflexota bacterium]